MLARFLLLLLAYTAAADPVGDGMHPHLSPAPRGRNLKVNPEEHTKAYWIDNAQGTVLDKISRSLNNNVAKNVILFLGDGMSIPTVAAARVYLGGEEVHLSFDNFPYTGLSKTYAVDRQVADSANTATAYLGGVKANYGTIGVGPEVERGDCQGMAVEDNHVHSIAYYSQLQGKRTGLVTTARVTHASPAGVYAHTAERNWESDADLESGGGDLEVCTDIASQLVKGETGKGLNVVLGGGRAKWLPEDVTDEEGEKGNRKDGVNLIDEWLSQKTSSGEKAQYVWNKADLAAISEDTVDLLGLFDADHIPYNLDRDNTTDPSLEEMTHAAIKVLSRGDDGYFLFVEGARIDMAHHATQARRALEETSEFAKAIAMAASMTSEEDTLIVVTSDHAHTMSYSGYGERGHDILEFGGQGMDGKVYTTLNYANGPGYRNVDPDGSRHDPAQDDLDNEHYGFPAVVPLGSETHGGDDVAIFARGPFAHLFSGVIEQNVIPHLMSYASCVGEGHTACDNDKS